ncbi:DUF2269 domain-containing protein [Pseudovibrio sp. Ad26]|uniref:DUF2269 family protein n=1 Tax=Pseudovibrio sp. Ad26 TaxID=989410 RepID=UPI0007AE63D2|nr:DUF2269 domain-containing protein [Pseudovibrio sp. Ad26]KZL05838.1 hypothetical protein PsAD26_03979 [Pseudovibrio sp. Ad26]
MTYEFLKFLHIIGACVLIGTGAGIAFFMVIASRTLDAAAIAHTAGTVVIADTLFTATAVIIQPITGYLLARDVGWSLTEGWIVLSLALYMLIGVFWLPVVWIQIQLRNLATTAVEAGTPLPPRYHTLYRIWFACGFPAFIAILGIVWLMIVRPPLQL